jgi:hypothetical protein
MLKIGTGDFQNIESPVPWLFRDSVCRPKGGFPGRFPPTPSGLAPRQDAAMIQEETWKKRVVDETVVYKSKFQIEDIWFWKFAIEVLISARKLQYLDN